MQQVGVGGCVLQRGTEDGASVGMCIEGGEHRGC